MKAVPLALLLSLPFALHATEVQRGATIDEVRNTLGAPQGQVRLGDRQLLYYDRGEVELRSGAVTRVALLSVEEHAVVTAQRAAAAVKIREEQEIRRTRLVAEGEALRNRKLADANFQAAPISYQVAFWEDFSRRYPDVPVAEPLTVARLRLTEQIEQKRAQLAQEERLAELEIRVREAEARAAEADSVARRTRYYSSYYGGSYARYSHRAVDVIPVTYRYYDAPVPATRSPGSAPGVTYPTLPPAAPVFPGGYRPIELPRTADNCDDDRDYSRRHGGRADVGPGRFAGRNRL